MGPCQSTVVEALTADHFYEVTLGPCDSHPAASEAECQAKSMPAHAFMQAAAVASSSILATASDDHRLELYALYKQATVGCAPSPTKDPMWNMFAQQKFKAWSSKRELTTQEAQQQYIELVEQLKSSSNPDRVNKASAPARASGTSPFDVIEKIVVEASRRGLAQLSTEDVELDGRVVTVNGIRMVNFSSCSFLGLEKHELLIAGAEAAVRSFGTQFSSSRSYISLGLYRELEAALSEILGGAHTIAVGSTTLGHLAALPALVNPADAVILDQHVHASVQMAANYLKSFGVHVETLRHNRMDLLADRISVLKGTHGRIWYMADGVYSMFGNVAPLRHLYELADAHPSLYLYIDDAHGFSWTGAHGRGRVLREVRQHERMVLAVSLNKCFGCAGGAIALPNAEMHQRMRSAGPTLIFAGPIQPPMLGAAVASAKLHLSDQFSTLQAELAGLIAHANECCRARKIPLAEMNDTPIFFVPVGTPEVVYSMTQALLNDGCLVNGAAFPAVPMKQGGIRFVITRHHRREDIEMLTSRIAFHYPRIVYEEHGGQKEELETLFKRSGLYHSYSSPRPSMLEPNKTDGVRLSGHRSTREPGRLDNHGLSLTVHHTIAQVDPLEWDTLFDGRGTMNHGTQTMFERVFAGTGQAGQDCLWRYVFVRDKQEQIVAATYFCINHIKDDMFAPVRISEKVEAIRKNDPSHLVSLAVVMGSPLSLGDHLYVDRSHSEHRSAIKMLVQAAHQAKEECHAEKVMLRDFTADDPLADMIPSLGFVELSLPDRLTVDRLGWPDADAWLAQITDRKKRYSVRHDVLRHSSLFEVVHGQTADAAQVTECYKLYRAVHKRGLAINVFPLPEDLFSEAFQHPDFDLLRLYVGVGHERRLAAFMLSHFRRGHYLALIVGLDYTLDAKRAPSPYKQALYQTVQRANQVGALSLDLACTADREKKRLGAVPKQIRAFLCADDDYSAKVMANL